MRDRLTPEELIQYEKYYIAFLCWSKIRDTLGMKQSRDGEFAKLLGREFTDWCASEAGLVVLRWVENDPEDFFAFGNRVKETIKFKAVDWKEVSAAI